jgi:Mlc titration factor MtfA (ptsG expression regulator)
MENLIAEGVSLLYHAVKWIGETWFNKIDPQSQQFLFNHFRYYRCLNEAERRKFDRRVVYYINSREWEGRQDFTVSREVRLVISAVATQVTFGFNEFSLPYFKHILVYPRKYFSNITQQFHKGEVNLNGIIVLNWEDIMDGIQVEDDGISLGIHEFAHAVYFENLKDINDDFFIDKPTLQRWYDAAAVERDKYDDTGEHFFRDYAFTNKEEFWAVSTEYFFEQPTKFRELLPDYYEVMRNTFRQDPEAIYARGEKPLAKLLAEAA